MDNIFNNLFEFLAKVAWPVVALIAVVWFRDSIIQIATGLGGRA